jgi:hypothetical protein
MAGPRVCMECEKPIRDKVYLSIPGLSPNSICIDCAEKFMEKAVNEARNQAQRNHTTATISMRSVVSQIVQCVNEKETARKNIPTATGIQKSLAMGLLTISDLEEMLTSAREDEAQLDNKKENQ